MEDRLKGRIALVTGAARRLGRDLALALAARGVHLVLHFNTSRSEAEEAAAEARRLGVRAWLVQADLSDPASAERCLEDARRQAGPPDFLVNSASVYRPDRLEDLAEEGFLDQVRVNALSPFFLGRSFARQGREGAIVNLLDCRVGEYDAAHVSYNLSKRLLHSLTRMAALEYAPRVRVNAVAPGIILPPEGAGPREVDRLRGSNPLKRWGEPEDVSRAVVFLLESGFVTGQVIYVDGGRALRGSAVGGEHGS